MEWLGISPHKARLEVLIANIADSKSLVSDLCELQAACKPKQGDQDENSIISIIWSRFYDHVFALVTKSDSQVSISALRLLLLCVRDDEAFSIMCRRVQQAVLLFLAWLQQSSEIDMLEQRKLLGFLVINMCRASKSPPDGNWISMDELGMREGFGDAADNVHTSVSPPTTVFAVVIETVLDFVFAYNRPRTAGLPLVDLDLLLDSIKQPRHRLVGPDPLNSVEGAFDAEFSTSLLEQFRRSNHVLSHTQRIEMIDLLRECMDISLLASSFVSRLIPPCDKLEIWNAVDTAYSHTLPHKTPYPLDGKIYEAFRTNPALLDILELVDERNIRVCIQVLLHLLSALIVSWRNKSCDLDFTTRILWVLIRGGLLYGPVKRVPEIIGFLDASDIAIILHRCVWAQFRDARREGEHSEQMRIAMLKHVDRVGPLFGRIFQ